MASVVESLLTELSEYHDETGDSRAGSLVSLLYAAKEHADSDTHKEQAKSRKEAEAAAAKEDKSGGN